MKNIDTDKIIASGLIIALIFYFVVVLVIALVTERFLPLELAGNIVTGLAGYMGRSLAEKLKQDKEVSPPSQ